MSIYELYSQRGIDFTRDIFSYDTIPDVLRNQIVHIWSDSIGPYKNHFEDQTSNNVWDFINDTLCREYGVFELSENPRNNEESCIEFLLNEQSTDRVLDIIELSFHLIDTFIRKNPYRWLNSKITQKPDDAIQELNQRFRRHGLGYQYNNGKIIRIDSNYIHNEAVIPALTLLHDEDFRGASEEFLTAHQHYREGNNKEAISEALKAFESVMKTICSRMEWEVSDRATAAHLIQALFDHELIPACFQTQIRALKTTLEGLPTVRNRNTGHGQGVDRIEVPNYLVSYALHLCATNIVFLIDAYKAIR